jgi:uncharacterized protein with HEPN domain
MRPDDEIRLRHLTEAASKAVGYCADRQRADLDSDELLRLALTKLVEIVGEAAKHISLELQAAEPGVPWAAAARMRDRLVHHYFHVNLDILWETITEPPLGCSRPCRRSNPANGPQPGPFARVVSLAWQEHPLGSRPDLKPQSKARRTRRTVAAS